MTRCITRFAYVYLHHFQEGMVFANMGLFDHKWYSWICRRLETIWHCRWCVYKSYQCGQWDSWQSWPKHRKCIRRNMLFSLGFEGLSFPVILSAYYGELGTKMDNARSNTKNNCTQKKHKGKVHSFPAGLCDTFQCGEASVIYTLCLYL